MLVFKIHGRNELNECKLLSRINIAYVISSAEFNPAKAILPLLSLSIDMNIPKG